MHETAYSLSTRTVRCREGSPATGPPKVRCDETILTPKYILRCMGSATACGLIKAETAVGSE